jgi:hypothetical protein
MMLHQTMCVLLGIVCHHTAAEEGHEHGDAAWEWAGLFDLHADESYG